MATKSSMQVVPKNDNKIKFSAHVTSANYSLTYIYLKNFLRFWANVGENIKNFKI